MIFRANVVTWIGLCLLANGVLAAEIPIDRIEPANCLAIVTIKNFAEVHDQFSKSDFGRLWKSSSMAQFRQKLPRPDKGLSDDWMGRYGFTEQQFLGLARRQVVVLVTGEQRLGPRLTTVIETVDHLHQAKFIQAATEQLRSQGYEQQTIEFPLTSVVLSKSGTRTSIVFAWSERFALISDDLLAARTIAENLKLSANSPASSTSNIKQLNSRLNRSAESLAQWVCDPDKLLDAIELPQEKKSKRRNSVDRWLREGFVGVKTIGGSLAVDDAQVRGELIFESEKQPAGLLRLLDVPSGPLEFPAFVPSDSSRVAVAQWNVVHAVEKFGEIYDDLTQAPGAFVQTLADTKTELNVDLQGELLPMLGPKVCTLGRYDPQTKSEQSLVVFDIKQPVSNSTKAAEMVHRLFVDDTETKQTRVSGHTHSLWEISLTVGDSNSSFANAGLMVANEKLWCATHASLIKDILQQEHSTGINADEDFRRACAINPQADSTTSVQRSFTRIDRDLEYTFNTLRTKGPSGLRNPGSVVAMVFAIILGASKQRYQVDFSALPEYSLVSRYLGTTTWSIEPEQNQWRVRYTIFPKNFPATGQTQ